MAACTKLVEIVDLQLQSLALTTWKDVMQQGQVNVIVSSYLAEQLWVSQNITIPPTSPQRTGICSFATPGYFAIYRHD
jgi:hypothetical protein